MRRKENSYSTNDNYVKAFIDSMPVQDMTSIIYWDKQTQNLVDSRHIRDVFTQTCTTYRQIYEILIKHPSSPYVTQRAENSDAPSISLEEFLWAFSIVSSRHIVLDNTHSAAMDDKAFMMLFPLLDLINHSF